MGEKKSGEKRTVEIHGKQYETVASRVQRFREDKKELFIETEVLQNTETLVLIKASIKNAAGQIVATGHAEEKRNSSPINKTSALENAETSAIGRVLACLGYIGTEFASADEVANAIKQQNNPAPKVEKKGEKKAEPVKVEPKLSEVVENISSGFALCTTLKELAKYAKDMKETIAGLTDKERNILKAAYLMVAKGLNGAK